ncbi:Uncharacterised protein [Metamycoplasma cloacale]|uniref:Uncharacterized protein n=1 Tax=Metamycoplasma cloacale TaxID=92401 RepID=A0A2Z4LM09_9BACT|nr:hypothetical protein [Metamycoplasma cloacale]AWX42831.1 hypothetical protein DK849_02005 [Metamycoplasma cloacale]VEU79350.1 Uncharacterised protein [Metamycoplasma cloacale]
MLNKESDIIKVNTKMNFCYYVEKEVILEAIKDVINTNENILLMKEPEIVVNKNLSNLTISIDLKIKKLMNFCLSTKELIFLIEQKVFSLINNKPTNINLVFHGLENEDKL